jgi:16S rRNA processing protein RimM
MTTPGWVLLARLVRPQGRKGEIIAQIFTDFPNRFKERPRVFLTRDKTSVPPREMLIEKHWLHQGRVVLKFKDIDSINDAETLRGMDVVVPLEERVPLADDAVYIGDLIGCRVLDVAPVDKPNDETDIGEVMDIERGTAGAPDLLVIRPSSKHSGELLIPFAKTYLVSVDVEAKRITMRLPAGLTELNDPDPKLPDAKTEDSA